jgi:beta-fructofuranosidase
MEVDGKFHIFYCGRYNANGQRIGTICHATSDDLIHWTKDPANPLLTPDAPTGCIGQNKDPFVFWNAEEGCYWMLITDMLEHPPTRRHGALALAVSHDLQTWTCREPFWAPDLTMSEFEVPDLFEWNGRWYLTYTTYSEGSQSHYRVADHLTGPWLAPAVDTFDGGHFYAARTCSDGERRFVFAFAWIAGRCEEMDDPQEDLRDSRLLVVRELTQHPDGRLSVKCPPEVLRSCGPRAPMNAAAKLGRWSVGPDALRAARADGLAYAVDPAATDDLLIETTVTVEPGTRCAGILFRTNDGLDRGYTLRLEPASCRVVFDRWPRRRGTRPFMVEQALHPDRFAWDEPMTIQLFVQGTIAEAFVDDQAALVVRIHAHKQGCAGLFVENGAAMFGGTTVTPL